MKNIAGIIDCVVDDLLVIDLINTKKADRRVEMRVRWAMRHLSDLRSPLAPFFVIASLIADKYAGD